MPTDRTPVIAAAAGVGAFLFGRFVLSPGGTGPAASAPAAATSIDPSAAGGDQANASLEFPGVLQGIDQGLPADSGGTVAPPYPLPAPAPAPSPAPAPAPTTTKQWWPSYLPTPPATATFAVRYAAGTSFNVVDSNDNYVRRITTSGGFSAYGTSLKTARGTLIGKLITGPYVGIWVQVYAASGVYLKP